MLTCEVFQTVIDIGLARKAGAHMDFSIRDSSFEALYILYPEQLVMSRYTITLRIQDKIRY